MQPMDITTLRAVLSELRAVLVPGRFEKAQQSDSQTVQLAFRSLEGSHWLELSWQAEAPRLLAIPPPAREGAGSTLAQQLQYALKGLALVALEQHGWERVVELVFARRPGEPGHRSLVLELMGRRSNLFLLDEERRVVALGRQVRQDQSRLRPIGTGDPYRPPPAMAGDAPRGSESEAEWRRRLSLVPLSLGRALRETYQGISPALARQLAEGTVEALPAGTEASTAERLLHLPLTDLQPGQWWRLHRQWQSWLNAVERERFCLRWGGATDYRCWRTEEPLEAPEPETPGAAADPLAINRGLAAYYGEKLAQRQGEELRQGLRQRLLAAIEREGKAITCQQSALEAVAGCGDLQRRADALLSQPCPDRPSIDEAQKLYRQARRLRRSVGAITPRLEAHRQRLAWLEDSLTFLEQSETVDQLRVLEEELRQEGAGGGSCLGKGSPGPSKRAGPGKRARRRQADGEGPPEATPQPLELRTVGGVRVQVGRNHRQNEWISLRQARRGDLWFHAQECPGSHVVLKGSEQPVGQADLMAAADLAALFSRARGNGRVPVVMVPAEELQRIPGAAAGTVRHRGGEILWGEPDRARLLLEPAYSLGGGPP